MRVIALAALSLVAVPIAANAGPCLSTTSDLVSLHVDGDTLQMCQLDDRPACFGENLTSGTWSVLAPPAGTGDHPAVLPAADAPKVDTGDKVKVCLANGSCKTFAPSGNPDPGMGVVASANETGTLAVISYLDRGRKENRSDSRVETFDLATGKRVGNFVLPDGGPCTGTHAVGESVVVALAECGSPPTSAALVSKTGKKIAAIGGAKPIVPSNHYVHIARDVWAFASASGDEIVMQDVKTGKVTRRIAVGKPAASDSILLGDFQRLLLVHTGDRAGDVDVIAPTTGQITTLPAARCK